MLSSPNDESPANVDAAVGVYIYLFIMSWFKFVIVV
jgi:hypothetical protein